MRVRKFRKTLNITETDVDDNCVSSMTESFSRKCLNSAHTAMNAVKKLFCNSAEIALQTPQTLRPPYTMKTTPGSCSSSQTQDMEPFTKTLIELLMEDLPWLQQYADESLNESYIDFNDHEVLKDFIKNRRNGSIDEFKRRIPPHRKDIRSSKKAQVILTY